jgi:citronellol/citronellal dehydrogenase
MQPGSQTFAPDALAGRVVLVTGGGTNLGKQAAIELAAAGAEVVIAGRREEVLAEAAAAMGERCSFVSGDVREVEDATRIVDVVRERHARLDVLVNNAGGQFLNPAESISPKGFRTVVDLNVQGTWQMTHAAATKAFIPQRAGKVVSVTVSPHHGMPGMVHTGAARAAVENMMRTLSIEWARFGIRLCAVAAGQFDTEVLRTKYPREVSENVARTVPLGRLGTEDEMAWLIAFLASPAGDFFSGAVLTIDGARDNWFGSWPPSGATDAEGSPLAEERRPDE